MKLKENARYTKLKEQLWKVFEECDRGEVVHYGLIIDTIKIGRNEQGWNTVLGYVRRRLLSERGIATRCEPATGVRLFTHSQQVVFCANDRSKRIVNQARKGFKEVHRADSRHLSDHERRLQVLHSGAMQSIKEQGKSSVLDITVDK